MNTITPDVQTYIDQLGLVKHPEGGYFKEIYQNREQITAEQLSVSFTGRRSLATSIYFLLPSGEVSRLHRLKFDELWYYHAGAALTVVVIDPEGELRQYKLGLNIAAGEMPQIVIPGGNIFGAMLTRENSFSLVGCLVTPGFDYQDFELLDREQLIAAYPQHKQMIMRLT